MRLELRNVEARYGAIRTLAQVDLFVGDGEIVAVLGANGSGKSTLTRVMMGLHPLNIGQILLDDEEITQENCCARVQRGLSLVPEGRALFPRLSVRQNLKLGCYTSRTHESRFRLEQVFELFPRLAERAHQAAGNLSGGEQQMLAIGRALVQAPRLLILDEPSLGLAPNLSDTIYEKIQEIQKGGCTIVLVDEKASDALRIADRAYVLSVGQIEKKGKARELLDDPEIQEIYLGFRQSTARRNGRS